MELSLHRTKAAAKATLGHLLVDGAMECVTLEDVVRLDDPATPQNEGAKIQDQTAIPAGRYPVIVNMSPRFKRLFPRILNVPGFDGILIHSGNSDADTKGCVLVGQRVVNDDWIQGGSAVFPVLLAKVQAAQAKGEPIHITITNDFLEA